MLEVNRVLAEISAQDVPQILVMNKIDDAGMPPSVERDEYGKIHKVWVSARQGFGVEFILQALAERYPHQHIHLAPQVASNFDMALE